MQLVGHLAALVLLNLDNVAVEATVLGPCLLQRFGELVIQVAPTSREEFGEFIRAEAARWAKVIKAAGIVAQ